MKNKFLFSAATVIGALTQVVQAGYNNNGSSSNPVSAGIAIHFTAKGFTFDTSNMLYGAGVTGCLIGGTDSGAYAFVDGQYNYVTSDDFTYPSTNKAFIVNFFLHSSPVVDMTSSTAEVNIEKQKVHDHFGSVMVGIGKETYFESDDSSYSKRRGEFNNTTCAGIAIVGKLDISRLSSSDTPSVGSAAIFNLMLRKSHAWAGSVGVMGTLEYICEKGAFEASMLVGASLYGRDNLTISYKAGGSAIDGSVIALKQNIGFTSCVDVMYVYRTSSHVGFGVFGRVTWDYRSEEYRTVPSGVTVTSYEDALTKNIVGNLGAVFVYKNI